MVLNPNFQNTSHLTAWLIRFATLALVSALPIVQFLSSPPNHYGPSLAPSIDLVFVLVPTFICTPVPTSVLVLVSISVREISPATIDSVLLISVVAVPPGAPDNAVSLPSLP